MSNSLLKQAERFPELIEDAIAPWSNWFRNTPTFPALTRLPAVNVVETPAEYKLTLAAPGLSKSDFKIDVNDNCLTVSAQKEDSREEKDKHFTRREYSFSSFARRFDLPQDVKQDKIDAKYQDGILELVIPKNDTAKKNDKMKQIKVH